MRAFALLTLLMLGCAGCGYRGPLYLPQSKPAASVPPAPAAPPERPEPAQAIPAPQ
jgi:predicted small lipoprotein YifL